MTISEMTVSSDTAGWQADSPRALTGARARVDVTAREVNAQELAVKVASTLAADARNSWFAVASPPSLTDWLAARKTVAERVPDGSPLLRGIAVGTHWTLGLAVVSASVVLFATAGLLRWLSDHPLRLWSALFISGAVALTVALVR